MTVKSLAFMPHLSSAYWVMAYEHNAMLHNITYGNDNSSPYTLWHGKPFDLIQTPILPFRSVIAAHRPLADQTALSGRSQEAMFVGIAPNYAGGVTLFNPTTKRTFIRHSFKYLSDIEPVSTSYVVAAPTPADEEVLSGPISDSNTSAKSSISSNMGYPVSDFNDYTYVLLTIARTPSKFRFAFANLQSTFFEKKY